MKKGPKPATTPSPNLEDLLSKYDAEKELLLKQNSELEHRIHQQISQNHRLQEANNSLTDKLHKLQNELSSKERQLLLLQSEHSNLLTNNHGCSQAEYEGALWNLSESLKRIKQDQIIIEKLEEQLQSSKFSYDELEKSYKQSLEDSTAMEQVRYLEENIEKFKKETEKLKSLLSANLEEVKDLTDTNLKLESKLKERKKKYKELEVIVGEQQIQVKQRMTEYEMENGRVKNQLLKSRQEFQRVWKDLTSKNTTIEFQKLQLAKQEELLNQQKMEDYKEKEEREQREAALEIKCSTLTTDNIRLREEVERTMEEMLRTREQVRGMVQSYEIAYKMLKQKMIKQIVEKRGDVLTEQLIMKIDRLVEQVRISSNKEGGIMRLKERQKQLQNQIKHLKQNSKSKSTRSLTLRGNEQIIRLENQLAFKDGELKLLQNEASETRESNEANLFKIIEYKKRIEELQKKIDKEEIDSKKREQVYTLEMKKCLNELYEYKDKLSSMKQSEKDESHYKEMMGSKIAGYEKKIKELLESIDRKDDIVRGLKESKKQNEALLETLHERINRAGQVDDVVRKLRQDLSRKDELMNSYKSKHDMLKHDFQSLRESFEKLQKQAIQLDKELQRKNTYINTMKDKYQKQMSQIEKKLKSNSDHTKSISNVMEHKLISIKKECLNYQELIEDMKKHIWDVIEQLRERELEGEGRRNKSKKNKKENKNTQEVLKSAKDWEATKVLGLKESELEEFINPKPQKISRKVYQQKENELQRIWLRGEILEYFQAAIGYMIEIISN